MDAKWTLILPVLLSLAWLLSEFQQRRWLRLLLGVSAITACVIVVGYVVRKASKNACNDSQFLGLCRLIDTVITNIDAGNQDGLVRELEDLRTSIYDSPVEGCPNYTELVKQTAEWLYLKQSAVAPPQEMTDLVKKVVPGDWICESNATSIIVRPCTNPIFVCLISSGGRDTNETLDDYYRRHMVHLDYRITLRFGPQLSSDDVRQRVKDNLAITQKLRAIEHNPLVRPNKGSFDFPQTPEGQALLREYTRLNHSIKAIPDGYYGNVSVYIEPTFLNYATFLHEESKQECEAMIKTLTDQLTPYATNVPEGQNAPSP